MTLLKRSSLRGTILRCRKKTHEEWIISIDILQVTLDFRAINIYRWSDDWWATFLNNFSCWKGHSCRYWIQTVPNTTHFEHFRGCDIPGTRIMRWLGLKKTPSRNNTWSQTSKPKVLPTRNVQSSKKKKHELAHSSTTSKSRKVPCWTALVTSGSLLGDLYTGDIRVWPAGCWVQGQVWPLCMYVCLFGITWEDNFRKTTRWKKRPYKSHTHISPFNQKIWFLKRCDMLLSFHQLKCPPPFQMPRIPGVFPWVVVATPYVWQQQPPSRDTSGTQAAWKASLAVGKWSTSRFQRWRQETHRETNPAIRWLKALNTEPKKNMTYTHCPLFFWWGGKGATEKKKGQTKHKIAPLFATIIR